jgi:predicted RNA-binding protein with PUA-like domain
MPKYFLAKTDPETFSMDDFAREKVTTWSGVHSYAAIAFIKQWKIGDRVYIYQSMGKADIAGISTVVSQPIFDVNDERRISWVADLRLDEVYPESKRLTLKEIKASGIFDNWSLVKQSRLSVMPCPDEFVQFHKKWMNNK